MVEKQIYHLKVGDYAEKVNTIRYEDAMNYATITGDCNPIHFDTEVAQRTPFKRPVVHGMILAGFISSVIGVSMPGYGCIYESQTLKFTRPVFYGDTIRTCVTITSIDIVRNRVELCTECFNQIQDLVLEGKAIVLPRKE